MLIPQVYLPNPVFIHWIADGIAIDRSGEPVTKLATNRYRAIMPVRALAARGHKVKLIPLERWADSADSETETAVPEVVVVGKLLPLTEGDNGRCERLAVSVIDAVTRARVAGAKVVADINDDHFNHPTRSEYWHNLVAGVDAVTAGSPAMAEVVRRYCSKPFFVVGDPLGSPAGAPAVFKRPEGVAQRLLGAVLSRYFPPRRLKLIWYGHPTNWPAMSDWAERIVSIASDQPLLIQVVTRPGQGVEEFSARFNARYGLAALMEFVSWEEETVWDLVRDSHIVLIPSDLQDPRKSVKTANRLTDALHCGRFAVASPVPSYQEFGECAWLGDDLIAGIRWALENPDKALERIERGQMLVSERCSMEAVAERWEEAFAALTTGKLPALPIPQEEARDSVLVRLNLGCGDKLLKGYTNVDVAPSRRGLRPDVLCDLHDLSCFPDGYADEILSVHVVEHFWRWEVSDILREWVRVLKPGGRMIIECPNLVSACEALMADPEAGSEGDARGQRTMWVLYGDPGWRDPLMTHRWGYTPHSLGKLMRDVGLINVRQEPAQFKLREPRDMRLVGEKPR